MAIDASNVKKLREQTGAGVLDCKNALEKSDGDFEKATESLRKRAWPRRRKRTREAPRREEWIHTFTQTAK